MPEIYDNYTNLEFISEDQNFFSYGNGNCQFVFNFYN